MKGSAIGSRCVVGSKSRWTRTGSWPHRQHGPQRCVGFSGTRRVERYMRKSRVRSQDLGAPPLGGHSLVQVLVESLQEQIKSE